MVVLIIIATLNLISYVSVKDWKSTMILLLAGLVTYNTQKGIVLFLGILAAALFRSVLIEGLENPAKEPETETKKKKNLEPVSTSYIEGLAQRSKDLSDQHGSLLEMTKQLGPMMIQAENLMKNLPEGFLDKALERMKTKEGLKK